MLPRAATAATAATAAAAAAVAMISFWLDEKNKGPKKVKSWNFIESFVATFFFAKIFIFSVANFFCQAAFLLHGFKFWSKDSDQGTSIMIGIYLSDESQWRHAMEDLKQERLTALKTLDGFPIAGVKQMESYSTWCAGYGFNCWWLKQWP